MTAFAFYHSYDKVTPKCYRGFMLFALQVINKVHQLVGDLPPISAIQNIEADDFLKPINEYNISWFHLSAYYGVPSVTQVFLNNDINMSVVDKYGHTALHYAAIGGWLNTTKLLIGRGINIDAATKFGDTALHYASLYSNSTLLPIILSHNASLEVVNRDGLTPLHYAMIANNTDAESLVLQARYNITKSHDKSIDVFTLATMCQNKKLTSTLLSYYKYEDLAANSRQMLHLKPIHFAKLAKNCAVIDLLKNNGVEDEKFSAPTFYERSMQDVCNGKDLSGLPIFIETSFASSYFGSPGFVSQLACWIMFMQLFKALQNNILFPVLNHLYTEAHSLFEGTSLDIFINNVGSLIEQQVCSDIYYETIEVSTDISSFKRAVGYLKPWENKHKYSQSHESEYLVPLDHCRNKGDREVAKFHDLGVDWTLCQAQQASTVHCPE